MPNRFFKALLFIGIIVLLLFLACYFFYFTPTKKLVVSFLDVGQGDAALIQAPAGQNILIDGGPNDMILERLSEELPFYDRQIDLMILTHPHDDHVEGLNKVLEIYQVGKIVYTGVLHTSPVYLHWLEIVKDKNIPLVLIEHPQTIDLGKDCYLEIVYPGESFAGQEVDNLNNTSIVARLNYLDSSFLFTGDIEEEVEQKLSSDNLIHADILKVPHHGSDTSCTEEFIEAVEPKIAVISLGQDNQFGFPSQRILNRLDRQRAIVYRTDQSSTIRISTRGQKYKIKSQ